VNIFLLYLLLLKASLTSFTGLGSLPMIRQDFVVDRHLLTDQQLTTAVVAGRTSPGPYGIYIVCVAYLAGGVPGAIAGMLAVVTPAFLVIPLMKWVGARAETPRIRSSIRALMLASAGLLLYASIPLSQQTITGPVTLIAALACSLALVFTRLETMWLIFAAAVVGLAAHAFGLQ
jgi:chromate transporter